MMNNSTVLKALADSLQEQRERYLNEIARGQYTKIEEYRECVGLLRGLEIATSYIVEMNDKLYKEDDDVN